jgi:starch synthase (maltosyl-transferring)
MKKTNPKARAVIESVYPVIENGIYPVKRVPGEALHVQADIYGDGHDHVKAQLNWKTKKGKLWHSIPMEHTVNDRFEVYFIPEKEGEYEYRIEAWIDHPETWLSGFKKKVAANDTPEVEFLIGIEFINQILDKCPAADSAYLNVVKKHCSDSKHRDEAISLLLSDDFERIIVSCPLKENPTETVSYPLVVERKKALFSSWYEFFPRSASQDSARPGTFKDCKLLIPKIADLGFDTVYFPPIHPIGVAHRKGKNNSTTAQAGEPGSPWAIGSALGGHKSINPELGSLEEFKELVNYANEHEIEIALDLAYQCSPDHPYVKEHPQWFKWRPDGTVQYAENPPKKYQDVLPILFEQDDWQALWAELKDVIVYWIKQGIKIFRVDNPHTKSFVFWEWLMAEMRKEHPEVIFLSEAFTRPKVRGRLAKVGFQQSYTYFTWRQNAKELKEYMTELTQTELREYFRPNFWPNTPDILPFYLQNTGYPHAAIRFVLAATLSSNYGMYGPVFELLETEPYPGKEEYNNSEKYEVRHWDWDTDTPMRQLIRKIKRIRHQNPQFHTTYNIQFCETDNEMMLAYIKSDKVHGHVLIVVNLDPHHKQSGWVHIPNHIIHAEEGMHLELFDLMDNNRYYWSRQWNYVELDPVRLPTHIFKITSMKK